MYYMFPQVVLPVIIKYQNSFPNLSHDFFIRDWR